MGDEAVPEMQGGVGVAYIEAGDEVILVGSYCTFWGVGTMKFPRLSKIYSQLLPLLKGCC